MEVQRRETELISKSNCLSNRPPKKMSKQNVEIKARINVRIDEFEKRVQEITGKNKPDEMIFQNDTFFRCDSGRLKLRIFPDGTGELISYARSDVSGPKVSSYCLYSTKNPLKLKETLCQSLECLGSVDKRRLLYMHGSTRIHIDDVEGLNFPCMELEVTDSETAEGMKIAMEIKEALKVEDEDLFSVSYFDLLSKA